MAQHEDYIKLHQHRNWGVSWQEYDVKHRPGYKFNDTMWEIFNERILKDQKTFGRHEYLCMYQLLVEEGRRQDALTMLLQILYIDLSGIEGYSIYRMYKQKIYTLKQAQEFFSVAIMLAPRNR